MAIDRMHYDSVTEPFQLNLYLALVVEVRHKLREVSLLQRKGNDALLVNLFKDPRDLIVLTGFDVGAELTLVPFLR